MSTPDFAEASRRWTELTRDNFFFLLRCPTCRCAEGFYCSGRSSSATPSCIETVEGVCDTGGRKWKLTKDKLYFALYSMNCELLPRHLEYGHDDAPSTLAWRGTVAFLLFFFCLTENHNECLCNKTRNRSLAPFVIAYL